MRFRGAYRCDNHSRWCLFTAERGGCHDTRNLLSSTRTWQQVSKQWDTFPEENFYIEHHVDADLWPCSRALMPLAGLLTNKYQRR